MDSSEKPQVSTARQSDELFPGAPVHVRLPFMGPSANAWAQRKERERLQQMQQRQSSDSKDAKEKDHGQQRQSASDRFSDAVAIPLVGPAMPASQRAVTRSSGLDYDEELALPMPKPRVASKPPPPSTTTQAPPRRGLLVKDRSATDPGRITVPQEPPAIPKPLFADKKPTEKKSKVSTLKSKFSIKDMMESSKDSPKTTAKKIEKETTKQSTPSSESEKILQMLSEPKLYVPKPKVPGLVPSSAPPTSVPDRLHGSSSSLEEPPSRTVRSTPAAPPEFFVENPYAGSGSNVEPPRRSSAGSAATVETPQARYVVPREKIEGMIIGDPSLSPTRTGTYAKSGNPEVVKSQSRIVSMQAEVERGRQASAENHNRLSHQSETSTQLLYSPSVYGVSGGGAWEELQQAYPDTMPQFSPAYPFAGYPRRGDLGHDPKMSSTVNVSSGQTSSVPRSASGQECSVSLVPTAPAFKPNETALQDPQHGANQNINETDFFGGVTSHGGYAPPPPDPEYQNTATLEQQLWNHVSMLHHHMNSMTAKLTRVFGDTNNWHMDQVLRNVDNLGDVARILTTRAVGQTQIASESRQLLTDVRGELEAMRREARFGDRRLSETIQGFQREIMRLHQKVDALYAQPATPRVVEGKGKQRMESMTGRGNLSAQSNITFGGAGGDSSMRQSKADELSATHTSAVVEESPSDVPTPTAAFRTPSAHENEEDNNDDTVVEGDSGNHPLRTGQESTGSPTPKGLPSLRPHSDPALKGASSSIPPVPEIPEDDNQNVGDSTRTPWRRGVFGFGKRRDGDHQSRYPKTPRHIRVAEQGAPFPPPLPGIPSPHVPHTPSRIPSGGPSPHGSYVSPSAIHPVFRNPRQQQVMREREQRNRYQQRPRFSSHRRFPHQTDPGYQRHHQSYGYGPSFPPNPAANNPYMSYPPMYTEPNMPPMPSYPPPPPPRNLPSGNTAGGPVVPAPSVPDTWGSSHWYQAAYGDERAGGNQPYQK